MLSSMKRPTFTYQSLCPWPDLPWAWSSRASSARHPSSQVDSIFTALCHPCSLLALSRPRPPTPLRLNGTPRIHLDVLYIWRLLLGSKHISDIVLAPNGIRPGLVCCLAWSRRQLQLYMLRHLPMRIFWCVLYLVGESPSKTHGPVIFSGLQPRRHRRCSSCSG